MLTPWRMTTRPWASVIQRPEWLNGAFGTAPAGAAATAAAARSGASCANSAHVAIWVRLGTAMGRSIRRLAVAGLAVVALAGATPAGEATFKGRNGLIAFSGNTRTDLDLFVAKPGAKPR